MWLFVRCWDGGISPSQVRTKDLDIVAVPVGDMEAKVATEVVKGKAMTAPKAGAMAMKAMRAKGCERRLSKARL